MYVDVDGCYSHVKTMNIGLPQGSVSSPYLFSLYVNDMCLSSSKLQFIHFADDTILGPPYDIYIDIFPLPGRLFLIQVYH